MKTLVVKALQENCVISNSVVTGTLGNIEVKKEFTNK
jgi:hypothetical protein